MRFDKFPTWIEWRAARGPDPPPVIGTAPKPPLIRIDELVQKYHQVFEMSRLNILMELKNTIITWTVHKIQTDPTGTNRLEAMRALQEVVLRKLIELDNWGKHRYLNVVCIGYEAKTGAYNEDRKPANAKQRQWDETIEIDQRCSTLKAAIAAAFNKYQEYKRTKNINETEDDKILKIFMAPEFFFRGPYGAYADIGRINKVFSEMRNDTEKAQYDDWLFVHGTVIVSSDKMKTVNNVTVKEGVLLENYALVQKGGPKTRDHQDLIFAKEFPSHVDFKHPLVNDDDWYDPALTNARVAGTNETHFTPQGGRVDPDNLRSNIDPVPSLDGRTVRVSELVGGAIFTMDGITFGLEVCRDHLIRRLAHSSDAGKVQIQLVPSCGASLEGGSVACVRGGVVFNVDGGPSSDLVVRRLSDGALFRQGPFTNVYSGGDKITLFDVYPIPWPASVSNAVALQLNLSQGLLSGTVA